MAEIEISDHRPDAGLSLPEAENASMREPLLDAIAQRIRTELDNRATRQYLAVCRAGRRTD